MIQVEFVGNHPITWEPPAPGESQASDSESSQPSDLLSEMFDSQATISDSGFPATNAELKRRFVDFVEEQMRRARDDSDSESEFCNPEIDERDDLKGYYSLLAIIHDPTSALIATETTRLKSLMKCTRTKVLHNAFDTLWRDYLFCIDKLGKLWSKKNIRDPAHLQAGKGDHNVGQGREGEPSSPANAREFAAAGSSRAKPGFLELDREAQEIVPGWYNKMCTLTGGTFLVEAAHIIDLPVPRTWGGDKHTIGNIWGMWSMLRTFWPLKDLENLTISGDEQRNILSLGVDAHRLWDSHQFALRPLEHPTDPTHRLYLQMIWLKDITTEGNLARSPWDHRKNGTITDFRRGSGNNDTFLAIQHGDVYELVTADEATCPLPNMNFLRLRYAIQRLLAGMMSAAALRDIFQGPPPSGIEGPVPDEAHMPGDWEMLIEAAQQEGILSVEAAKRWRRYVLEEAYQDYQEPVAEYTRW